MYRVAVAGALMAVLALGCGRDPHAVRITESNKDKLAEELKDMKGLTVEEGRLLFGFLMRQSLASSLGQSPPSVIGKTVGDLISEQRTFETDAKKRDADQAQIAAEAKAKEDALATQLRSIVALTVFDKGFSEPDLSSGQYQSYILLKCAFENHSQKDVRAFTGAIRFTDLFDKPITDVDITVSDPVKAGAKGTSPVWVEYNNFNDTLRALRTVELKDLKVVWVPRSIIHSDGTRIGSSD